jgi:sugar phosphate isomerase/epimerase
LKRRDFLKTSGTAAALGILGFSCSKNEEKTIGIQLWTVHEALNENFDATIKIVTDIGYKRLEGYGYRDGKFFDKTPKEIKRYFSDMGVQMTSTHTDIPWIEDNAIWNYCNRAMADAAEAGCKWLIQPYYQIKREQGIDGVKRLADHYNRCGTIAKANGIKFGYHNLTHEFEELDGEIPYEVLLNYTDKDTVSFQIDTVQLVTAGYTCHEYIQQFPGRFGTWHIKDTPAGRKGDSTDLGKGVVDFKGIFDYAELAGMEDYFVEQEDFDRHWTECLKHDYDFLNHASFVKW